MSIFKGLHLELTKNESGGREGDDSDGLKK